MHERLSRKIMALAALALLACDSDDPFTPSVDNVSGSYTATTFTTTIAGVTTDQLAAGASVTLTLAAVGTTSGRLFVPDADEDGGDFDADLTGTWTLTGTTVSFAHSADTFIRDINFVAADRQLTAEGSFGGDAVRLVLSR
ncbi:MAG: hypothetical protein ACREMA_09530 [Longimicrobiales bacterium]